MLHPFVDVLIYLSAVAVGGICGALIMKSMDADPIRVRPSLIALGLFVGLGCVVYVRYF